MASVDLHAADPGPDGLCTICRQVPIYPDRDGICIIYSRPLTTAVNELLSRARHPSTTGQMLGASPEELLAPEVFPAMNPAAALETQSATLTLTTNAWHYLIVTRVDGELQGRMQCPWADAADDVERECATLSSCGCQEAYERDSALISQLLDEDEQEELELADWHAGCYMALKLDADEEVHRVLIGEPRTMVTIQVPAHTECPKDGREHQLWEGEVVTATGPCAVIETFTLEPHESLRQLRITTPGRYPVASRWDGEDFELYSPVGSTAWTTHADSL